MFCFHDTLISCVKHEITDAAKINKLPLNIKKSRKSITKKCMIDDVSILRVQMKFFLYLSCRN